VILNRIQIHYAKCDKCSYNSNISVYKPKMFNDIEDLRSDSVMHCAMCKNKLEIKYIKSKLVEEG
jgi:hypothetical protein